MVVGPMHRDRAVADLDGSDAQTAEAVAPPVADAWFRQLEPIPSSEMLPLLDRLAGEADGEQTLQEIVSDVCRGAEAPQAQVPE